MYLHKLLQCWACGDFECSREPGLLFQSRGENVTVSVQQKNYFIVACPSVPYYFVAIERLHETRTLYSHVAM